MHKKKFIGWVAAMVALILSLMIIIIKYEPKQDGISRALAYKALALTMASEEELKAQAGEKPSLFPLKEQDNWFVPYMDYLYQKDYLSEELTLPRAETALGYLTYKEVGYLLKQVPGNIPDDARVTKQNKDQPFPKDQWWLLYDGLRKRLDSEEKVREMNLLVYGTPLNVENGPSWIVYTNQGDFGFEGLAMDSYIDREIKVLIREGEIITVKELVSNTITYKNIWLRDGVDGLYKAYLGSITREFQINLDNPEQYANHLADLELKEGTVQKVSTKKDRISGRVLEVKEDSIEIEGYGEIPLDENFKVYKIYGEFRQQKLDDILVGYDIQEFVTAENKLCAALTTRPFDAQRIRVLVMTSGFQSIFHKEVQLLSNGDIRMTFQDEETLIPAGEPFYINTEDERLKEGRMMFEPAGENQGIEIASIQRATKGNPVYSGRLEMKLEPEGLVIVNDLYMEDYLTYVVPSEMPATYEMEALKAQAVCARTYAYGEIKKNAYSQYGAHVNDSTDFQVYNNIARDEKTSRAVEETYGMMLLYQDNPIEAFYFSTSCGHTTDGTIWGADLSSVPYLKGVLSRAGGGSLNLTSNVDFVEFIKNKGIPSYESKSALYRWETTTTSAWLGEKITGIGTVTNLIMRERGTGGIGKVLEAEGTQGSKTIQGQGEIRRLLGNKALIIQKNDGEDITGWDMLPSAFISIERKGADENGNTVFRIYGGGYGHGVGMSQNGAQGMALAGKDYKSILQFYYSGVEVTEIGDVNQ